MMKDHVKSLVNELDGDYVVESLDIVAHGVDNDTADCEQSGEETWTIRIRKQRQ